MAKQNKKCHTSSAVRVRSSMVELRLAHARAVQTMKVREAEMGIILSRQSMIGMTLASSYRA